MIPRQKPEWEQPVLMVVMVLQIKQVLTWEALLELPRKTKLNRQRKEALSAADNEHRRALSKYKSPYTILPDFCPLYNQF